MGFVKKYRTLEEAERDLWVFSPDKTYVDNVFKLLLRNKLFWKNIRCKRGIFRYKSLEEAEKEES